MGMKGSVEPQFMPNLMPAQSTWRRCRSAPRNVPGTTGKPRRVTLSAALRKSNQATVIPVPLTRATPREGRTTSPR
jgi:hypothetical protein